jgi:hypothetical protein
MNFRDAYLEFYPFKKYGSKLFRNIIKLATTLLLSSKGDFIAKRVEQHKEGISV